MRAERMLPYAKPWILIDEIIHLDSDSGAMSMKQISSSDFYLQGHFPTYSVYPGMLLLEGISQTIACMLRQQGTDEKWTEQGLSSRFLRPVQPGDSVKYVVRLKRADEVALSFHAEGWVEEHKVIQALIAYRKEEEANEVIAQQGG